MVVDDPVQKPYVSLAHWRECSLNKHQDLLGMQCGGMDGGVILKDNAFCYIWINAHLAHE